MKSPHLQACDLVDALDELVRARPQYQWRENWTAHVRKLLAELHVKLVEADREVGDAFDAKRTRWGMQRRPCAWCGGPLPDDARCDVMTCSKRCRQAKSRGGTARKLRIWPKGIRTSRAAARATDATSSSTTSATDATSVELDNRRKRRGELDDWRSDERRAQRQQLTMSIAPPIGAQPNGDTSDGT
jgi:hypothetical protein